MYSGTPHVESPMPALSWDDPTGRAYCAIAALAKVKMKTNKNNFLMARSILKLQSAKQQKLNDGCQKKSSTT
jgi:hypothetical protein